MLQLLKSVLGRVVPVKRLTLYFSGLQEQTYKLCSRAEIMCMLHNTDEIDFLKSAVLSFCGSFVLFHYLFCASMTKIIVSCHN